MLYTEAPANIEDGVRASTPGGIQISEARRKNKEESGSVDARASEILAAGAAQVPVPAASNVCEVCQRQFEKFSRLGVHMRRMHPDESHLKELGKLKDKVPVKKRWDEEEICRRALVEARLIIAENTENINQEIMKELPERTIEAIKCKRRPQIYKKRVEDLAKL